MTAKLVEGAIAGLAKHGVADEHVDVAWRCPGLRDPAGGVADGAIGAIPYAVICLGAVIRGETTHFELVANEAARGVAQVALETGVPVIFEVLATDDLAQAESRAGGGAREQGMGGGRGGAPRWHGCWTGFPTRKGGRR